MVARTALFSICSNNYLAQAEVFFASARAHHPEATLVLGLADRRDPGLAYPAGVEVLEAEDLGIADFDSFDFPLTQVDLADTLGMSTVHMNRSLQDLRSAQLIELCRNRLTIPNSAKLEAFARSRVKFPHLERTAA